MAGRTFARSTIGSPDRERGLAAAVLTARDGDETRETWSGFELVDQSHPALKIFTGDNNPFLRNVKVFRWWKLETKSPPATGDAVAPGNATRRAEGGSERTIGSPTVRARLSGVTNDPAMIERTYGRGRVFQFAFPVDAEWSNWPSDPSYLIAMQELTRYLARGGSAQETIEVGATVRLPLSLTEYRPEATLTRPDGSTTALQARPITSATPTTNTTSNPTPPAESVTTGVDPARTLAEAPAAATGSSRDDWELIFDDMTRRGIYTLTLTTLDNQTEQRLLAVNIPVREGNLAAAEPGAIDRALVDTRASRIGLARLADASVRADSSEWWKETLVLLLGVLGIEQGLAWFFGWRRRAT